MNNLIMWRFSHLVIIADEYELMRYLTPQKLFSASLTPHKYQGVRGASILCDLKGGDMGSKGK